MEDARRLQVSQLTCCCFAGSLRDLCGISSSRWSSLPEVSLGMRPGMLTLVLATVASGLKLPSTLSRRSVGATVALAALRPLALPLTVAAAPPGEMLNLDPSQFSKIPGGGQYADLRVGTGSEVVAGSTLSINWVLRRSNGYFVDASSTDGFSTKRDNFDESKNFVFTVGDGTALSGVDAGVRGMRQGGTRRLVLPIKAAYSLPVDKSGGPLPDGYGPRRQIERELQRQDPYNYFYIEVEATRVR